MTTSVLIGARKSRLHVYCVYMYVKCVHWCARLLSMFYVGELAANFLLQHVPLEESQRACVIYAML